MFAVCSATIQYQSVGSSPSSFSDLGMVVGDGTIPGPLPPMCEALMKFLNPGFSLAHLRLLWLLSQ